MAEQITDLINFVFQYHTSKHSLLIQRRNVGQRDIHVDSTSICQRWLIDKIQRWNNVDFGLTLKTILFSYHHALKIKIFISTLKR